MRKERERIVATRISNDLYNLIGDYASLLGVSNSEVLRELIREGLLKKSYLELIKRWQKKIEDRDPMLEMRICEKCGKESNELKLYHIDGNVRNLNPENLAILCEDCLNNLHKFIQKYNPKEEFAAWFFY